MTQVEKIIDYINEHGSITPLTALREFGCMRLASRITDIKRMGYNVTVKMEKSKNRHGEAVRYARYSFKEEENNA